MADKKEIDWEVATIISLVNLSETVHVLPITGGLLDQDSLFIHYYMYIVEVREMRRQLDEHKNKALQHRPKVARYGQHA